MVDYLHLALAAVNSVHHMTSQEKDAALKINKLQCRLLSQKLSECFVHLRIKADLFSFPLSKYQNGPLCKQFCRIALDVESLVRGCCDRRWLNAAIMLGNSQSFFAFKACELQWCDTMLCTIMQASKFHEALEIDAQIRRVEEAVVNCELKMDGILRAVDAAAVQDQERLSSKLKGVRDSGSAQGAYLAKYLLQRMNSSDRMSNGIPMWEVKPKDLKEIVRLRMGRYGITYEGTWLEEKFAVKVFAGMKDERSFRHETTALAGLWHPYVVPLICCAVNMDEGECSLVMELMSEDLYSFMRRRVYNTCNVPFKPLAAIDTMLQIAEGMQYLHTKKVAHRELTSSNILVNPVKLPELAAEGYVHAKVADLCLPKTKLACGKYPYQTHLTGTSRWMAPEVFDLYKHVTNNPGDKSVLRHFPLKADVYSYGMVCYEILTGKVPFVDEKYSKLHEIITSRGARPELPSTCPKHLASLIQRCWDGDSRVRPSFARICKELRHLRSILMTGDEPELQALEITTPQVECATEEVKLETSDFVTEHLKSTLEAVRQLKSPETSLSMRLNSHQCIYLAEKLDETVSNIEMEIKTLAPFDTPFCAQQGKLALEELYHIVKDAESLIQDCCKEQWLKAAIKLADCMEAFAESLSLLQWCASLIHINIVQVTLEERVPELVEENLKKAMEECGRKVEHMVATNKKNAVKDRDLLRQKLKMAVQNGSKEERGLAQFLLRRLNGFRPDDQGEPYYLWNMDPKELDHGHKLGNGSSGIVYKTTWLGESYASKTFQGAYKKDFQQEAATLVQLRVHPQVVAMFCCSVDKEGTCSIVMELMEEDLDTTMKFKRKSNEGPPFDLHVAVDIMLQIAEGMQHLHKNGVVHRDLKSSNVLVTSVNIKGLAEPVYHVKVADFGLSKTKLTSAVYTPQTLNVGTTRWMAPELYKSNPLNSQKKQRAFKCDVYSYAITCFEILTGKIPFNNESMGELKDKVMKGLRPELPSTCPRRLADLIKRCWHEDANRRPSFHEICIELRHLKSILLIGGDYLLQSLDVIPEDLSLEAAEQVKGIQHLRCSDVRWNQRFGRSTSFQNPVREMAKRLGCSLLFHSLSLGHMCINNNL